MCTLIYATLPSAADLARLPPVTVRLFPSSEAGVAARLLPGELLCGVGGVPTCGAGGHCGTVLGSDAPRTTERRDAREAAQVQRRRKQGWSEHKIQVWLAQKHEVPASFPQKSQGAVDELARWNELLRAALEDARIRYVGLLVFTAGQEPELPTRVEQVAYGACDLSRLEATVLYRIHRSGAARPT